MSKRLEIIASYIENGIGFIDVGTDHGYIPAVMAKRGYAGNIYASDINEMPLEMCRRNLDEAGFADRINFLLCDGLDCCPPDLVDTIVIAGMGGDTIAGILDRAEWCLDCRYKLILQPMTKSEVLRYWLSYNGFVITDERLIKDNGKIYQLLCSRFDGQNHPMTDCELFTGKLEMIKSEPDFPEYIELQKRRFIGSIDGLRRSNDESLHPRLAIYEKIYEVLINYDSK